MRTRRVRERNRNFRDYQAYSLYFDILHQEDYKLQDSMLDPIAFAAKDGRDTLHYGQAMRAHDKRNFIQAMVKEVEDHVSRKHWGIVPRSAVPKGHRVLDAVWSFKRKRDIATQQIIKWKARLTVHGGQQEYGIHYTDTYSPVVNWSSVRLMLILAKLNDYHTRQVDFVLAYPQADIPFDNYMKLPKGISTKEGKRDTHALKLKKNI